MTSQRIPISHRVLVSYVRGRNHPAKLRIVNWLIGLFRLETVLAETSVGLMRLNIKDLIQWKLFSGEAYEAETIRLVEQLLGTGDCFVDVGANVGMYSLAAARCVGTQGRVIAIEPSPEICAELLSNRRLNHQETTMLVVAAAAADANCLLSFAVPISTNELNRGRCREIGDCGEERDWFIAAGVRLREILAKVSVQIVHVMKIDVEGSELRVLKGLFDNLHIPEPRHIIFEFLPNHFSYGKSARDLLEYLEDRQYEILTIDGARYHFGDMVREDNLWARKIVA